MLSFYNFVKYYLLFYFIIIIIYVILCKIAEYNWVNYVHNREYLNKKLDK